MNFINVKGLNKNLESKKEKSFGSIEETRFYISFLLAIFDYLNSKRNSLSWFKTWKYYNKYSRVFTIYWLRNTKKNKWHHLDYNRDILLYKQGVLVRKDYSFLDIMGV